MGTKYPELFAALAAPIPPELVKFRPQAGRQLSYITARTAMIRLDEVLGPENWWDEYLPMENSVLCRLSIRLPDPDGTVVTKADAGGYAGMSDSGDDDKSGYSDAFKRACVKFGIARELYRDGSAHFGADGEAPRSETPKETNPAKPSAQDNRLDPSIYGNVPVHGKAMFPWVKSMEEKWGDGLLKYLNGWAKQQGFPFKMTEWTVDQVDAAVQESIVQIDYVRGVGNGNPSSSHAA